jgi:hypothetical protein
MTLVRMRLMMRLAATLLGGVLLVAGLLKASTNFSRLYHFGAAATSNRVVNLTLLALAAVEVAVAMTLMQRPLSPGVWRLALILFAAFFVVALTQAIAGRQVCDCFGAIVLKPHYTALFDLLAACICGAATRIIRRASPDLARGMTTRPLYSSIVAFVLTICGLLLLRESRFGDIRFGIPPVVAELQLNQRDSGDLWMSGSALLASRGREPVRVVGCLQSCGLQLKRALPFEIKPTTFTCLPLLIRRPSQAQVGLVPLTLFVEVRGSLEKLTLPLLTPQIRK